MTQPATAAVVATSQRAPGRLRRSVTRDRMPVKTGAGRMVTTALTASPGGAVAAKKAVWYAAAAAAPAASSQRVRVPRAASSASAPPRSAKRNSSRPPPMMRAAPTAAGPAPAGAKVRAVAVVPHRVAANRMQEVPPGPREERRKGVLLTSDEKRGSGSGAHRNTSSRESGTELRVEVLGCAPVRRRSAG